jgi:hypothetical protein
VAFGQLSWRCVSMFFLGELCGIPHVLREFHPSFDAMLVDSNVFSDEQLGLKQVSMKCVQH